MYVKLAVQPTSTWTERKQLSHLDGECDAGAVRVQGRIQIGEPDMSNPPSGSAQAWREWRILGVVCHSPSGAGPGPDLLWNGAVPATQEKEQDPEMESAC